MSSRGTPSPPQSRSDATGSLEDRGDLWVEVTLRLPQDEAVHPEIVRDDLLQALDAVSWSNVTEASVTDTSPGYMEALNG